MNQIVNLPTAQNSVIHLHETDNIAVARVPLSPGVKVIVNGHSVMVKDPVPPGHKVALSRIGSGEQVTRWGQMMGRARQTIEPGEHVHVHNVYYEERLTEYEFPSGEIPLPTAPDSAPTFLGYPREDGRVGTRNYIAVVAASNCAAFTVSQVARLFENEKLPPGVDGVAAFPLDGGCSIPIGPETDLLKRTLNGILHHPNVSGAVMIGLGCEVNQVSLYFPKGQSRTDRVAGLTLQGAGGTKAAVEAARREVWKLVERAASEKRVEVPAGKLILGLQCGGSDSFSGITANPALGRCSDMLVNYGGAAVLAETPECFGAEHLLASRSRNRRVAEKFLGFVEGYKEYLRRFGCNFDDNPTPGNKEGGLTTILEKSLGAAAKAGTSPMTDAVDYGEAIETNGFVFMNTPGNDPMSMAGLAAGGSNIMAFTTGRGSASGFPIVPVIKISSNSRTFRQMPDDMDINAGRIADGEAGVDDVGQEIFDFVLGVASGKQTCSERLGHNEFVVWRIGPVL